MRTERMNRYMVRAHLAHGTRFLEVVAGTGRHRVSGTKGTKMLKRTIGFMLGALLVVGSGMVVGVATPATVSARAAGRTIAPDFVAVSDFRSGEDANGNNTTDTCVDFFFDEPADVVSCCARF